MHIIIKHDKLCKLVPAVANFLPTMALKNWIRFYSAVLLLASGIGNGNAQNLDCGGRHTANYGVLSSPNYPESYGTYAMCTYTINLLRISSITLNFETFELDRSKDDFVAITCESNSSYVEQIYRWNSNIPPISIPWCRAGRLHFVADLYVRNYNYTTRGFKVQYQVNTQDCGNTVFTSSSGIISSPNYPEYYNNSENCTYSIWAPETSSFALSFEVFHLEEDDNCGYDWVQIWCDDSGYILPKYCGSETPKPAYINNCKKVLIWFHTDTTIVSRGFSLVFSVTSDGCGRQNYAGLSGSITSPNYPRAYTRMLPHCTYYLYPVSSAVLSFQTFDLEPFIDTEDGDYVQIDCTGYSTNGIHSYRGNSLPPKIYFRLCSCVRIYFYTNNVISGTGFSIKYQVNPLVAHSDITTAPENFTVDVGSRVQLNCRSNAFDYSPSWTLSRDGTEESTTVIASFCIVNSDYASLYYTTRNGPGICNLVIINATLAEAGIYTCIDVGLASSSSVVTVMVPATTSTSTLALTTSTGQVPTTTPTYSGQVQNDSNLEDIVVVLAILLAICILCFIGISIFFIVKLRKEKSKEEGQRNTNKDIGPGGYSVETSSAELVFDDLPLSVRSSNYSGASTKTDGCYNTSVFDTSETVITTLSNA